MVQYENSVRLFLRNELINANRKYIIYPYGGVGKCVKKLLNNENNVNEFLLLDNRLSEEGVYRPDELKNYIISDDIFVIIATLSDDIYEECRTIISNYFDEDHILSVYPLAQQEFIRKLLSKRGFDFENNIYKLSYVDVKFYLPLWNIDYIQERIAINDRFNDDKELEYILDNYSKYVNGKIVLDIGANIGNHSMFFQKYAEPSHIHAYEPHPETFKTLKKNVEINSWKEHISIHNLAVGDVNTVGIISEFNIHNTGATTISESENGNFSIIKIDDQKYDGSVGLMKIDVEGFESRVIRGSEELIIRDKPLIMIEIFDQSGSFDYIYDFLNGNGYQAIAFNYANYIFHPVE